jgi:phosphopantothenoylcysteine decarboxylase/phosphopantothenate--cysteine ligase
VNLFLRDHLKFSLEGKKILLGITGSIAAFKACDLVRLLKECGAQVRVVLSQGAENFVTKTTLETLSGAPVLTGFWNHSNSSQTDLSQIGTHHIETARWADLILVAPATAHFIAKAANGFADDLLSTELLAFRGPVLVVPAMNPAMFAHPAVQANIQKILTFGTTQILGPTAGKTACGEEGLGRMIEPEEILQLVASSFFQKSNGLKALITLGPTRSSIDPVRYISNRSSGLMGASLCWAALQAGYQVKAICGPSHAALPTTLGMEVIQVNTAREMNDAVLEAWPHADVYIGAAAVLDWEIKNPSMEKLKKNEGLNSLEFEKNPDILSLVSQNKRSNQFVLGFAAETENVLKNAKLKLNQKKCDAIFVNDVSKSIAGFESDLNSGWWLDACDKTITYGIRHKSELARNIISNIPLRGARKKGPDTDGFTA